MNDLNTERRGQSEQFEDRLAAKIANEEDRRARRRVLEMWGGANYWTPDQRKTNAVTIVIAGGLFIGLCLYALISSGALR